MKKSVSYNVDVLISTDIVVTETQCECGAGQGPTAHCKHVGAVLYGITQFPSDKANFISEVTCTQVSLVTA